MNNRNELAADNIHGVYVRENPTPQMCRDQGIEILEDMDFFNALKDVKDGETIFGNVSDDIAQLIEDEYGIY